MNLDQSLENYNIRHFLFLEYIISLFFAFLQEVEYLTMDRIWQWAAGMLIRWEGFDPQASKSRITELPALKIILCPRTRLPSSQTKVTSVKSSSSYRSLNADEVNWEKCWLSRESFFSSSSIFDFWKQITKLCPSPLMSYCCIALIILPLSSLHLVWCIVIFTKSQ